MTLTPCGRRLPHAQEWFRYRTPAKGTRDLIVDTRHDWWHRVSTRFPAVQTLPVDRDNGPETHRRRTQLVDRLIQFAQTTGLTLELAYEPPDPSKYNPIERCWAGLETHWKGTLLDSVETGVRFARSLQGCGQHPFVRLVTPAYATGVKLTKPAMTACEEQIDRLPSLRKWFVTLRPTLT